MGPDLMFEPFSVLRPDEDLEALSDDLAAIDPQHRAGRQVGLFDVAVAVERAVADRREIVQIGIATA